METKTNNKVNNKENPYADIIKLPRHISSKRSHMSLADRAAQFSPFSAVVGHDSAVKEAARYTDERKELDESQKAEIDNKLRELSENLPNEFDVKIVYFKDDELKSGGKYICKIGKVNKIDKYAMEVYMLDGTVIAIDEIYSIIR